MTNHPNRELRAPDDPALNFLECWRLLADRRRFIGLSFAGLALAAFTVSLFLPRVYSSKTTLLTPEDSPRGSLLSALTESGVAGGLAGLGMPSATTHSDLFLSILKSRTMAEAAVKRFALQERYGAKYVSDAVEELQDLTDVTKSKEGVVALTVEETDPELAAQLANFFVAHLNEMLATFSTTEATKQKTFISSRLVETEKALRAVEAQLLSFQQSNQAISLPDQTRGAVEAVAHLQAEILAAEVRLQVLRGDVTEQNPEVLRLKRGIAELRRKLGELQFGRSIGGLDSPQPAPSETEILVSFANVPELALELARMTRDVRLHETVYALLTQQLEEAKIAEARDMPTVQVLDRALPAERSSKPKPMLFAAVAGFLGIMVSTFLVFLREYLRRLQVAEAVAAPGAAGMPTASRPSEEVGVQEGRTRESARAREKRRRQKEVIG